MKKSSQLHLAPGHQLEYPQESSQQNFQNHILRLNILFKLVENDGSKSSIKNLIKLKALFSRQLPKMPKNYITQIVFDSENESILVCDNYSEELLAGICFKVFEKEGFSELIFLTVKTQKQSIGIGTALLNRFKELLQERQISYILTYADKTAVNFFKKQGFNKECQFSKNRWQPYLKNYQGGITMQCRISQKLHYNNIQKIIQKQKQVIQKKINSFSWTRINFAIQKIFPTLELQSTCHLLDKANNFWQNPDNIPGLIESGWNLQQMESIKKSLTLEEILYCQQIILKLKKQPSIKIFFKELNLINNESKQLIQSYLNLEKLGIKLISNRYETIQDFKSDIVKMFENYRQMKRSTKLNSYPSLEITLNLFLQNLLGKQFRLKNQKRKRNTNLQLII